MDVFLLTHEGFVWKTILLGAMVVASCSAWWSWHPCDEDEANDGGRGKPLLAMAVRTALGVLVMLCALWVTGSSAQRVAENALDRGSSDDVEAPYSITITIAVTTRLHGGKLTDSGYQIRKLSNNQQEKESL
jgi:hypothetical protein